MTTVTVLPRSGPLTRADLDALPEDGRRHELVDGVLIVSPGPLFGHQDAVGRPAVTVLELRSGRYEQVAHVVGDDVVELSLPFPVRLVPSLLRD